MFYKAFADIKPGEAEFINDHDPKPFITKWKQKAKEAVLNGIFWSRNPNAWKVKLIKTIAK